ncbi:hypothetical protein LCGC14_0452770 [marine sediment metagenome]|uniref:Uncharacterized protein n=1 Tax=marine sediment metagenome TaxID=412755 RepID=A0A0F9SHE8_9ZZZZ
MARCPLKQDIRDKLWVPYARKLAGRGVLSKYLTLYSPPMMDIKHLQRKGLLAYDGETFNGVVTVAYEEAHFGDAISRSSGRPELFLEGDINHLLTEKKTRRAKQLRNMFPFQVINLDYNNSVFFREDDKRISENLKGIGEIFRLQRQANCREFVLFVTTRADAGARGSRGQLSGSFLDDLSKRITENVKMSQAFSRAYRAAFGDVSAKALQREKYRDFVPVGIAKLVAGMLAVQRYEIISADAHMLVRDDKSPEIWLLHLAFRVRLEQVPRATTLGGLGRPRKLDFERKLARFVRTVGEGGVTWLRETADRERLETQHGEYMRELASQTVDLPIPEHREDA